MHAEWLTCSEGRIMSEQQSEKIKKIWCELFTASKETVSWQWDDRFEMALAQFDADKAAAVKNTIQNQLGFTWEPAEANLSPGPVQEVIDILGGLKPGQVLFTSDPANVFLLCAWWPWNNGKRISIRVACHGREITEDQDRELSGHIRSLVA